MKLLCCEDHVELALDVAVDETGHFPVLEKVQKDENSLSTTCEYCKNTATYIVSN
ncbi:CxxH/CxxC protein [Guptibacillus hwajinpoensis]|uniref:CxxH/CxxC protein (TIGR04129 family) n=1 Tax=Guptibacillus hwajinpoensis TaxID=208199 RepID=A0ABU0K094_9BACL|nr:MULTISPECIES: CxxH/CxxC protein [Alkalihalobacillus]MDQ0482095.1 CxxH/CxxC protein (TIGR04129 family) [Alkalihalobacillus hemicentroti]